MAWKGIEGDQRIWTSSSANGINWDPQRNVSGIGTSVGPSLAVFHGHARLFMAWKGIEGDQGIWLSRTADGNNWDGQQNVVGIGSSIGPSASAIKIGASFVMVMTWKGIRGDQGIWTNSFDAVNWTPQRNIAGIGSSVGPSLTIWQ